MGDEPDEGVERELPVSDNTHHKLAHTNTVSLGQEEGAHRKACGVEMG